MPDWRRDLVLRTTRMREFGGLDVPGAEQARILKALGFEVHPRDGVIAVTVPSWRADVEGEPDLVEEVARVHGYDHIPPVPLPPMTALPEAAVTPAQRRSGTAKRALAARGFLEAATWSFMRGDLAALFGGGARALTLANPISADLDVMRPSILPNLLAAAARNQARGFADLSICEVGPQYADDTPKPTDNLQVTADAPGWYHPGRSGTLRLGANVLAHFGELHPRVLKRLEVKGPAVGFEAVLDRVPLPRTKGTTRPLLAASPFHPVERDFAFVVDEDVAADRLLRAVKSADKDLIAAVGVFDVYTGQHVGPGKKSIALSVTLQPKERTLTDAEIEAVSQKIVAAATKATGASLRT
jgi:phenylalanyl-tRNA synthetase beta chain